MTSQTSKQNTDPTVVNVQTVLNESPFSRFQWGIFFLCFLIVLLDGFDTAAIGFIAPSLLGEWGIDKSHLGPVLSAALFGLAFGALGAGPLADRVGRKTVLIIASVVMGGASIASGLVHDLQGLTIWRFITGLGLGAAMPNAITLMNEYCPDSKRSFITNCMFCGFPIGSAFGGFIAAWMIPHFGWRSLLIVGGVVPLILAVLMIVMLPESVRFMVLKNYSADRVRKVMVRIAAGTRNAARFVLNDSSAAAAQAQQGPQGLRLVFSQKYLVGTLALWVTYFMGLVIVYGLVNWMPVLFKEGGLDPKTATLVAALFPLGGVGAVFFGWLMDRFNANRIIAVGYALTAVSIWWIGQEAGNLGWLVVAVFVAGTIMNTAQSSMPALAAAYYPTSGRATGVAWMLGIGRFGGIAGSFLVAELTVRNLGFSQIFTVVAVPGLIAAAALIIKQMASPKSER